MEVLICDSSCNFTFSEMGNNLVEKISNKIIKKYGNRLEDLATNQVRLRSDPELIDAYKKYGEKLFGSFSRMGINTYEYTKLITIPDDVPIENLQLGSVDGLEFVEEKHRTWK